MNQQEQWRTVVGWSDYGVTRDGQVVSFKHKQPRILRGNVGTAGYRKVVLVQDGRRATRNVHVLVCEAFHGARPEGLQVRHLDGNPLNNAADNLAWGSGSENQRDKARHGTDHQRNKTHCPQGHPYAGEHLYVHRGHRHCRTCMIARVYARREAEAFRAAGLDVAA